MHLFCCSSSRLQSQRAALLLQLNQTAHMHHPGQWSTKRLYHHGLLVATVLSAVVGFIAGWLGCFSCLIEWVKNVDATVLFYDLTSQLMDSYEYLIHNSILPTPTDVPSHRICGVIKRCIYGGVAGILYA
jgi:hypothetical protein